MDRQTLTWIAASPANTYKSLTFTKNSGRRTNWRKHRLAISWDSPNSNLYMDAFDKLTDIASESSYNSSDKAAHIGAQTISKVTRPAVTVCKSYDKGATTYNDETTDVNDADANDVTFILTEVDDALYFSDDLPFYGLKIDIGTAGDQVATLVWEYWNETEWVSLTVTDGTSDFTQDGVVAWDIPSDWTASTQVGHASALGRVAQYIVRCRVSAFTSCSQQPLITQAWQLSEYRMKDTYYVDLEDAFQNGDLTLVFYNDAITTDEATLGVSIYELPD